MFRAFDTVTATDIILLDDDLEGEELDVARQRGLYRQLNCPHCKAHVFIRSGEIYAQHFAHFTRENCPIGEEKKEVLVGRAALYRWLKAKPKFADFVTVEKVAEETGIDQILDCWVELPDGKRIAYWIISGRLHPEIRESAWHTFKRAGISLVWVFVGSRLRRGKRAGWLDLTPTERECSRPSRFDVLYGEKNKEYFSIHYLAALDREIPTLHTFRSTGCIDPPQGYMGTEIVNSLSVVLVSPVTGEFVHPGEHEQLEALKGQELQRLKEEAENKARQQAELERKKADWRKQEAERHRSELEWAREKEKNRIEYERAKAEREAREGITPSTPKVWSIGGINKWPATCIYCGAETDDWYRGSGGSPWCVCFRCRDKDEGLDLTTV